MTTTKPSFLSVCRFVRRYSAGLSHEPIKGLAHFLAWFWRDERLGVAHDRGQIVGIAMARCIDELAQAEQPFFHSEQGRFVWVDDIVSQHALALPVLLQHALQRFGPREAFYGKVFSRSRELRMLPFRTVERLATTTGALTHEHHFAEGARRA